MKLFQFCNLYNIYQEMTFLKLIYRTLCYIPILIQVVFLILAIGSKLFLARIFYYGNGNTSNVEVQFFTLFETLYYSSIFSVILWIISTGFMIMMSNKYSLDKTSSKIAILGCIVSVIISYRWVSSPTEIFNPCNASIFLSR
jgi:hypothetical protein